MTTNEILVYGLVVPSILYVTLWEFVVRPFVAPALQPLFLWVTGKVRLKIVVESAEILEFVKEPEPVVQGYNGKHAPTFDTDQWEAQPQDEDDMVTAGWNNPPCFDYDEWDILVRSYEGITPSVGEKGQTLNESLRRSRVPIR